MAQLLIDAPVSASWVLVIVVSIVGLLLTRILNRIESQIDNHEQRIQQNEKDIALINERRRNEKK